MIKVFTVGCGTIVALFILLVVAAFVVAFLGDDADPPSPSPASVTEGLPEPADPASPDANGSLSATDAVTFIEAIDGDTVRTSAGTVRLIGIDTPERGQCGYAEASAEIERLVRGGDIVTLESPTGQNDRDRYERLLRYVMTSDGVDLGLTQLQAGHAVARYDSRDGYPSHEKESAYRAASAASAATLNTDRDVIAAGCTDSPSASAPAPKPGGAGSGNAGVGSGGAGSGGSDSEAGTGTGPGTEIGWWQQYGSCSQLKKNTVGHPTGPFHMHNPEDTAIYNWFAYGTGHNGDGDGDGLACE